MYTLYKYAYRYNNWNYSTTCVAKRILRFSSTGSEGRGLIVRFAQVDIFNLLPRFVCHAISGLSLAETNLTSAIYIRPRSPLPSSTKEFSPYLSYSGEWGYILIPIYMHMTLLVYRYQLWRVDLLPWASSFEIVNMWGHFHPRGPNLHYCMKNISIRELYSTHQA